MDGYFRHVLTEVSMDRKFGWMRPTHITFKPTHKEAETSSDKKESIIAISSTPRGLDQLVRNLIYAGVKDCNEAELYFLRDLRHEID